MTEKEISKQITRYINGKLNDREEDILWEQFLENEEYYRLFETELNLTDLYRNKKFRVDESNNNNVLNTPVKRYVAWTTSVAALILVTSMLYIFSYRSDNQPASYALTEIELTQMLGSDIFRDESPDASRLDQQINRSLSLALSGNTKVATENLNRLAPESLTGIQKIRVNYNLGILAYNEGNYELSLDNFLELNKQPPAISPDYVVENTRWYIANIYLKQDNVEKAVQMLNRIASGPGAHSEHADTLLKLLAN